MDAKLVANYLTSLKEKTGLTYEAIAEKSGLSESTVKNLFSGKSEDPRLNTVAPVTYALDGSVDEMYTGKTKDELKEISLTSIREMYEFQLAEQRKTNEAHILNLRAHYEQHIKDNETNHERLQKEKDRLIELFKKIAVVCFTIACIGFTVLISLLILEVTNPDLGWIRF